MRCNGKKCDSPKKDVCQKPQNLKGKPGECSAEQVRKCHGDAPQHPCAKPTKPRKG